MTLPNLFTLLRIVLIPVFGWLWLTGRHRTALWLFAIAGLTDVLDGFLARYLDQRTRLGAVLDPAADKLMLLVSFLAAAWLGAVPWWLAVLVIGRDVVLSSGTGLLLLMAHGRFSVDAIHPTRLGKYSTFFQILTIGVALVANASTPRSPDFDQWVAALVLITAALTLISATQYIATALRVLGGPSPDRPEGGPLGATPVGGHP